jgi:heat shock transcription factor
VPHLQTGTLNTFPQPNNELWEFSNPKFHRDHPDWLVGITRKKSAKELAAAAALAAQGSVGEGGTGSEATPAFKGESMINERRNQVRDMEFGSSPHVAKDGPDSQSLSKAITLMKDTHTSLERELAELKASNEMLWRQAMLSREEQLKSQKKLDSVMRFLAGQFGNMNMALLEDDNENASGSAAQPARISRMGKGRLIGDGINGLDGSPSDEDMDEDAALWESGDREEARQFWEVDDSGKMIKVPQPRGAFSCAALVFPAVNDS